LNASLVILYVFILYRPLCGQSKVTGIGKVVQRLCTNHFSWSRFTCLPGHYDAMWHTCVVHLASCVCWGTVGGTGLGKGTG